MDIFFVQGLTVSFFKFLSFARRCDDTGFDTRWVEKPLFAIITGTIAALAIVLCLIGATKEYLIMYQPQLMP